MHCPRLACCLSMLLWSAGSCRPAEAPVPPPKERVLVSALAGAWYPADAGELGALVKGYLAEGPPVPPLPTAAVILPHAGYRYSGSVAAAVLRTVSPHPLRRVVVLGPSHSQALPNRLSIPDATHVETPLGRVPLDLEAIRTLRDDPGVVCFPPAHDREHSVQIEIPLLQVALGSFRLVPVVVGQLDRPTLHRLAALLRRCTGPDTLVVASSDFTHFGASYGYVPFREDLESNIRKLDEGAFAPIRQGRADDFVDYCEETGITVCGRMPIALLLAMLPESGALALDRLAYDTSGRQEGDFRRSVSYAGFAARGSWPTPEPGPAPASPPGLSKADRERLLRHARETLAAALRQDRPPPESAAWSEAASLPRGAFVTLTLEGRLRGCIGDILPVQALYDSVRANALNAAFRDPRFRPLTPDEFQRVRIEISALTPPLPVDSWRDIELGRHGMILSRNGRRAVFLPQVAPEQGWTLEETLSHLAVKAGLGPGDWRAGASFSVFEAEVFHEPGA